jgi:hypothetical protein
VSAPILPLIIGYQVGYLANLIPIPGGVGVLEGGLLGALLLYGLPAAPTAAAVILYHAIALWVPTLGGTYGFVRLRGTITATQQVAVPVAVKETVAVPEPVLAPAAVPEPVLAHAAVPASVLAPAAVPQRALAPAARPALMPAPDPISLPARASAREPAPLPTARGSTAEATDLAA